MTKTLSQVQNEIQDLNERIDRAYEDLNYYLDPQSQQYYKATITALRDERMVLFAMEDDIYAKMENAQ